MRRRRLRTLHVAMLDRPLAESEAIYRAMAAGARSASVRSATRIADPDTGEGIWEIVLQVKLPRRRRGPAPGS